MRFAYADPPYPGQAKRWYRDHPDYAGEVDHAELITRLARDYPDGWALSTSGSALHQVISACPEGVRVAIWNVTNAAPPRGGNVDGWHWCHEAVIVYGGRPAALPIRTVHSSSNLAGFLGAKITGQKPRSFCRWVFGLLGACPADQLDDLFPGSGSIAHEWRAYCDQPWLPEVSHLEQWKDRSPTTRQRMTRRLVAGGSDLFADAEE